jgi:hypothetical protein
VAPKKVIADFSPEQIAIQHKIYHRSMELCNRYGLDFGPAHSIAREEHHMADIEHTKMQVDNFSKLAMLLPVADVVDLLQEIDRTDAFLPFYDPSAYMRISHNLPDHRDLAQAFLTFRKELARIFKEEVT